MKRKRHPSIFILLIASFSTQALFSQAVPAEDENIPYVVTFGKDAEHSWGDDDFNQIFFFLVPVSYTEPFYIRIYDPDTGGELDEMKGDFNTNVKFSIYGGKNAWSDADAQATDPVGNYKSGNILASKTFSNNARYNQEWYTFGPFNQKEGEFVEKFGGFVFKLIADGISGDDGNLYRYFMSTKRNENQTIEGGNVFTYEYTFRLSNNQNNVSQIYPYLDDKTTGVKISNYDWDNDGFIRVVSVAKRGELCNVSKDSDWEYTELPVSESERNTSMEIQFIKNSRVAIKNNNVVVIVQNQYGQTLPFFVIPIGGRPVYNPSLRMRAVDGR